MSRIIIAVFAAGLLAYAQAPVMLIRVPFGGIQPQIAVDPEGSVHMIYFAGDPEHGDVFYVRSPDWGGHCTPPIRVNSQPGSAVAIGNIRGARLALGRKGRIYVAWNGSSTAAPKTLDGKAPMLYARLADSHRTFEPQRNLITSASGIDGGGAIAADNAGNVYVFWHAPLPGGKDEGDRRVWVAKSRDDGKTFGPEKVAFTKPTGVCGCCGMGATADGNGGIYLLFRSASEKIHRDMYLLTSQDKGLTFNASKLSAWNVGECVMSSAKFAQKGGDLLAAWETEKQVFFTAINANSSFTTSLIPASGMGNIRKHPALAINNSDEVLMAWTEGMSWKKSGTLYWQIFEKNGRPLGPIRHIDPVPMWSLIDVFAVPDGSFRIVY